MSTTGERVRDLRLSLGLSQAEFSRRLNAQNTWACRVEKDKQKLTDARVFAMCREFGVNADWIKTGRGEMRLPKLDQSLATFAAEHGLSDSDVGILQAFVQMPQNVRDNLAQFVMAAAAAVGGESPEQVAEREARDFYNKRVRQLESVKR